MDYSTLALKYVLNQVNSNVGKYEKCLSKEDALMIFQYCINTITISNDEIQHPAAMCQKVNAVLSLLKSSVKLDYLELLKPSETTRMAILVMAVHIYKMQADDVKHVFNESNKKITEIHKFEKENNHLKTVISMLNENLAQLTADAVKEDDKIVKETRLLKDAKEKSAEMLAKVKDIQNQNELMNIQISEVEDAREKLLLLVDDEKEIHKQLLAYECKNWQMQNLNDAISKEEAKQHKEEEVNSLGTHVIDALQKLNEDLAQFCYVKADSDNIAEKNDNTQRKLFSLQKQIYAMNCKKKEQEDADNQAKLKLISAQEEQAKVSVTLEKLKKECENLYQKLNLIKIESMEMQEMLNNNVAFIYEEEFDNLLKKYRKYFGM